jgi:hypothetical protein
MGSVVFNTHREGKSTYRADYRGELRPTTSRLSRGRRLAMSTPRALVVDENCVPSCSS